MSRSLTNLINFLGVEAPGAALLGPDGPIASALPGYQARPSQAQVAHTVANAIRLRKPALIEAGTGTGKSLGLLVPAIASGKRIVYATATRALQDQLRKHDLPLLEKSLGIPFTWAVLKGRRNYACMVKAGNEDLIRPQELLAWLDATKTGDLGELDFDLPAEVRAGLVAEDGECPGRGCELAGECFYYGAREAAMAARVIVTNHAVLAQHFTSGRRLLPEFDVLIVDEAHRLEATIREALRHELHARDARKALAATMQLGIPELDGPVLAVREHANFYRDLRHWVAGQLKEDETCLTLNPDKLEPTIRQAAESYTGAIGALCGALAGYSCTEGLVEEWGKIRQALGAMTAERANRVVWAELEGGDSVTVYAAPVCVGPWLRSTLSGVVPIFASATLAAGAGDEAFRFTREQLGLTDPLELQVDSPFDYARQALYYLPHIEPAEGWERQPALYAQAIAPEIEKILWATSGRAFVLFTSYAVLKAARRVVNTGLPTRSQGDGSPRELLDWFRATKGAVLFATGAFWEGVDVPGQALSCVILDKIPFTSPSDPVASARAAQMGRSAFWQDSVPRAIMTIKQGLGRLIRREGDRGLLCILDPRLRTKAYGRNILEALPGKPLPGYNTLSAASLPHVGKFLRPDTRAA